MFKIAVNWATNCVNQEQFYKLLFVVASIQHMSFRLSAFIKLYLDCFFTKNTNSRNNINLIYNKKELH